MVRLRVQMSGMLLAVPAKGGGELALQSGGLGVQLGFEGEELSAEVRRVCMGGGEQMRGLRVYGMDSLFIRAGFPCPLWRTTGCSRRQ